MAVCRGMLEKSGWSGKRGPRKKLSIENVIVLNIIRFIFHIKDLKAFHKMSTELKMVDGMPSYANFVKATNSSLEIMEMFLAYLLTMGRGMNGTGIHYIDSTPLPVCLNMRIREHMVAPGELQDAGNPRKAGSTGSSCMESAPPTGDWSRF